MTLLDAIRAGEARLDRAQVDSPRLTAELILAHLVRLPRLHLYFDSHRQLSLDEIQRWNSFIDQRCRRIPLQHITGVAHFLSFELAVNPHVLIPRPETEQLAQHATRWLQSVAALPNHPAPRAADLGTGSGCLALALAHAEPSAQITAVDLSPLALAVAQSNARKLGLLSRITFVEANAFTHPPQFPTQPPFDLIVSNPPYIPSAELPLLQPEVRDHEPHLALDGGPDGLLCYQFLAQYAHAWLRPGGRLALEFGDLQAPALRSLFNQPPWTQLSIEKDLSGAERVLIVSRA